MRSYLLHVTSNLLQIWKVTFLHDKHYMQGTIVAMAAKMPEVILTEYGLLFAVCPPIFGKTVYSARNSTKRHLQLEGLPVKYNHRQHNITSSTTARYDCYLGSVTSGDAGEMLGSVYCNHLGRSRVEWHARLIYIENLTRFVKQLVVNKGLLQEIVVVVKDFRITSHSSSIGQRFCCSER